MFSNGRKLTSMRTSQIDNKEADAPPHTAISKLSVRTMRTREALLAPSDKRMAISLRRAAERAMRRFAMFAHAISNSVPTIPNST
jgi:hypothetical protein